MAYLENLYAALRTRLTVVWPEVLGNNIYEAEHADLVPYESLTPPYAVLAVAEMTQAEWGLSNAAYEVDVEIFYIAEVFGPSSTLRPKLEAARDDLLTNDLTFGQVLDVTALSWSATLPPNEVFLAKRLMHRAGKLTVKCLVGEVVIQL